VAAPDAGSGKPGMCHRQMAESGVSRLRLFFCKNEKMPDWPYYCACIMSKTPPPIWIGLQILMPILQ
jgi:hypothetical protein